MVMPLRPTRAAATLAASAHQPFGGIPHPRAAAAVREGHHLFFSPIAFSGAVASSGPGSLPALHAHALAAGLDAFPEVSNSLAARYARTGSFPAAVRVFATARARDVTSYNTILSAFPDPAGGLAFAAWMLRSGDAAARPDAVTITVALSLAAGRREDRLVRQLHARASRAGLAADVFIGNALVTAYSRGGFLGAARAVFEEMPTRDLVSWNALICGLAQDGGSPAEVVAVFLRMLRDGGCARPDRISVCTVVPACGGEGKLQFGRQVHGFAVKLGVEGHVSLGNVLVAMYYKCAAAGCARKLFEAMRERDVISWTTVISMDDEDATLLFNGMRQDGVPPNEVTFVALMSALPANCPAREAQMIHTACLKAGLAGRAAAANSLITMYAKARRMGDARMVFDLMPHREIIAWNALISGYAQNEQCMEALEVFSSMAGSLKPNETTFASVLSAVTTVETVSMSYGEAYHCQAMKLGLSGREFVAGTLIDMYAKRGSLEESRRAFDEAVHRSLVAWTAIISANAKHGSSDAVMPLFDGMLRSGVAPDGVVLLAVLTACRHRGLVDAGRGILESMVAGEHGGVEPWPEHYACVVDMLGRAGRLEEAEELMLRMPSGPSVSALQSLLGACRLHGDADIGERVADLLTTTEPTDSGAYVLLSNLYAEKGDWGGVAEVRRQMRRRGVNKEVGFSWVDAGAGESLHLHKFSSDDTTHPLSEEILRVAERLGWEMKLVENSLLMEMESNI